MLAAEVLEEEQGTLAGFGVVGWTGGEGKMGGRGKDLRTRLIISS